MTWNETWNDGPDGRITYVNCVYQISGTYGLLPRLVYYVTIVFAIFGRSREWLVIGALVSALTYAGTTAIHMMTLVRSRQGVYDLDIMPAWAVLSTGALAYIGLIHWSSTVRNSRARVILIYWGILVGIGLIFGRAELFDTPLSLPEPACYSSAGQLLEYPLQRISPEFNCTYECFSYTRPLRHTSEIMVVSRRSLENKYSNLVVVLVGPIQFAAYAALSIDAQNHTPSQLCQRFVMRYMIHPGHREEITKVVYKASMQGWYGGYFALLGYIRRVRWDHKKVLWCSMLLPWLFLSLLVDVLCLPLMVTNIVLNEITLLSGNYPVNESNVNIGQWGAIVNSALVIIAACINKTLEFLERRRQTRDLDPALESGLGLSPHCERSAKPSAGAMDDGQELGIVKPTLTHVQTLQNMDDLTTRPK